MKAVTEIRTQRLHLRTLTEDDTDVVLAVCAGEFDTPAAALDHIRWITSNAHGERLVLNLYIWIAQTNECIGRVYIHAKPEIGGEVEIGYGILEAYRNQDYATEAARALVQYAFEDAGQDALAAIVKPENAPSRRVIEKLGFVYRNDRMVVDEHGTVCAFRYYQLHHKPTQQPQQEEIPMSKKIKVGVAGYGVIGQRLADGVALQEDMELVGIADLAPTLSIRALHEKGMPYDLYLVEGADKSKFDELNIPTKGSFDDLISKVDVMLDSAPGGVGAKNKVLYEKAGVKAIFQGGEKNSVADVFFHGYANYEQGLNADFLKLTSCNTTGLIRTVDALDREIGVSKVAITIIRRVADPGDYHRGLTNALQMDKAPSHQAVDLMTIMPHVEATGILVHTPVTHGHIITVLASGKDGKKISKEDALKVFEKHPRIRMVSIDEGFLGNASLFRYARDLGNPRGDMYEVALWRDSIVESGNDIMFAINIPQESVTIPETIDGVRAAMGMQQTRDEGTAKTNEYLGIGKWRL